MNKQYIRDVKDPFKQCSVFEDDKWNNKRCIECGKIMPKKAIFSVRT